MTDPASRSSPAGAQRRAIIAEVENNTAALCRRSLEGIGFQVQIVASGVDALALARGEPPKVILLGEQLRDVPAWEVVGWLRANPSLRATPIIILGANAEAEQNFGDFRPGAFLRKPILPHMTQRTVTALVDEQEHHS